MYTIINIYIYIKEEVSSYFNYAPRFDDESGLGSELSLVLNGFLAAFLFRLKNEEFNRIASGFWFTQA